MVYILGIGRSGSTLLTFLLNKHPEIKAIPEVPLVLFFANEFKNLKKKSSILEGLTKEYLNAMQLVRPKALVNISDVDSKNSTYETYAEFCEKVFEQCTIMDSAGPKKIYVDKNPYYSLFIPELRKIDQNAKFIILVRDYRDNVLSRKNKQNNKPVNIAYNSFRNRFFLKELLKNGHGQDCLVLKYEDLVTNPLEKITEVCSFLDVSFNESIFKNTDFKHKDLEVEFQPLKRFIETHFSHLNRPITTEAVGKWKNELSEKEILLIESICDSYGIQYGYQKSAVTKVYFWYVLKFFPHYLMAKWHIWKEKIIYKIPSRIKLKRLKSKLQKGI